MKKKNQQASSVEYLKSAKCIEMEISGNVDGDVWLWFKSRLALGKKKNVEV